MYESSNPIPKDDDLMPIFELLIDETAALFHRLHFAAEQIHSQGELTAAKRGVLRGLERSGSQTVPQMARARPVSRQYIQKIVDTLLKDNLVKLIDNPAHKRSRLVCLTEKGGSLLKEMYDREARLLDGDNFKVDPADMRSTIAVLRAIRHFLESGHWGQHV